MAKINHSIHLDKKQGDKPVRIMHSLSWRNERFRIFSGVMVNPQYWWIEKANITTGDPDHKKKNATLDKQTGDIKGVIADMNYANAPFSKEYITGKLIWTPKSNTEVKKSTFWSVFDRFIQEQEYRGSTVKNYQTLRHVLLEFEAYDRKVISFDTFDDTWYDRFKHYSLAIRGNYNDTFGKRVKQIKTFLKWSYKKKHHINLAWQSFKVVKSSPEKLGIVALSETHVKALLAAELPEHLAPYRDVFIFSCYTGLAYFDAQGLRWDDITDKSIPLSRQKTDQPSLLPRTTVINELLEYLIERYGDTDYILPRVNNQVFNRYIKAVGKHAGLTEPLTKYKFRGNQKFPIKKPLYAWLTHHVARKTFITLSLYLQIPSEFVMRLAGITSYQTLRHYINFNNGQIAEHSEAGWIKVGFKGNT